MQHATTHLAMCFFIAPIILGTTTVYSHRVKRTAHVAIIDVAIDHDSLRNGVLQLATGAQSHVDRKQQPPTNQIAKGPLSLCMQSKKASPIGGLVSDHVR